MITQNMALQFLVSQPASKADSLKPEKQQNSTSSFKNVYGSVCSKEEEQNKPDTDTEKANKDDHTYKTYQEVVSAKISNEKPGKTFKAAVSSDNTEQSGDVGSKTEKKPDCKSAENVLSQILGIPANEIVKLLGAMNIKPEDMKDPQKAAAAVDKICTMMGLNKDQKQVLQKVVDMAAKICTQVNSQEQTEKAAQQTTEINNWNIKTQGSESKTDDIKDMSAKVKKALDSIIKKAGNDEQDISREIAARIDNSSDSNSGKNDKNDVGNSIKITDNSKDVKEEKTAKKSAGENVTEKGADTKPVAAVKTESSKKEVHNEILKENSNNKLNNDIAAFPQNETSSIQKAGEVHEAAELHKDMPVSKDDIIRQVVEKAKVVLDGNKSEMVMDLKPDNLGKLSLKVVTENGIVAAKFIAENQQVKETLETNMQLLKDSLEKQGLAVQEFSVSVGNNNEGRQNAQWNGQRSGASGGNKPTGTGIVTISPEMVERKINPYYESDSSINLTA